MLHMNEIAAEKLLREPLPGEYAPLAGVCFTGTTDGAVPERWDFPPAR